jgi:hypothetical protein
MLRSGRRARAKVTLLIFVVIAAALSLASAGVAGRDPRQEKLALRAIDTKRALNAVVHLTDLGSGWTGGLVKSSGEGDTPDCPWENYSAFTITGQAVSTFRQGGVLLNSYVQVFPTAREAQADFALATKPGREKCEGERYQRLSSDVTLISARSITSPKVGDHAAAYRYVLRYGTNRVYVDVIDFRPGRARAGAFTFNPGRALAVKQVVHLIDARLARSLS